MPLIPFVCDLYHSNSINFTKIKDAGIIGVIHKATQGLSVVPDGKYASRRAIAEEMGLLWGAYNFSTDDNVAAAIEKFFSVAKPGPDTRMCLDFEDLPHGAMSGDQAYEFLDRSNQKLGRATTIYGGNRIREHIDGQAAKWISMAAVTPLWLCQYRNVHVSSLAELNRYIKIPAPWTKYDLLQYAADGSGPLPHSVSGLEDGADLNVYDGTAEQLRATWAGTHGVVTPPIVTAPVLDVKWLQTTLNNLFPGIGLVVDGDYGHKTATAVCRFQAAHGLEVDGLAGPKTIAALAAR